jgi:hypothetical protein
VKLIRVLRGVLGTAAAWSLAWIPLTLASWSIAAAFSGTVPPLQHWAPIVVGAMVRGAISGAAFATVLAIAGRRRTFASLRLRDMVLWGAVGGIVAPAITLGVIAATTAHIIPAVTMGLGLGMASVLGAVSAAGTLWVARRAPELAAPTATAPHLSAPAETA